MRIMGLMSGTSADRTDAALVAVATRRARVRVHPEAFRQVAYPAELRE
jgi:1,6-anhydro-N-acetylmuramate kinase